ncbi:MAG TPA: 50S ribosomal protein L11 methyltransferase [Bacteroidales bacterium]|nr:50S ribosomal protein L11 methyltransferase [Bacteroidales bacterium]HRZ21557.1 50S ribosomal protein L11 methyltransferase [Bacteroidales bacterium]
MDYIEVTCHFPALQETTDRIISILSSRGFEGFIEEAGRVQAYIPATDFDQRMLASLKPTGDPPVNIRFTIRRIGEQNWNQRWESSYEPVLIGENCQVRAPFHPPVKGILYDIVIEPRMSFGTAHHATTQLMAEILLSLDVREKAVLDMGCGTGLLAVLAAKMGAGPVTAIDNDEWAYSNATENILKNNVASCSVYLSDASAIGCDRFDVILANINRNTLVEDMPLYAKGLHRNGLLVVSGFYSDDIEAIAHAARNHGMEMTGHRSKEEWASVICIKKK